MDTNKTIIEAGKDKIKELPSLIKQLPTYAKDKKGKKIIAIFLVAVLVIALLSTAVALVSNNETVVYSKLLYAIMPKELEDPVTHRVHYIEENENFVADEMQPLDAYNYYYIDGNGNRIDIPNGYYTENGETYQVAIGFLAGSIKTLNTIKTVAIYALVLVIIAVCVGIVYIAYKIWLKRELKNDLKTN